MAIVFESGFGMSLNAWALVQPAVANSTRACSYDRPGYGWSDRPPEPRTGSRAVDDLHRALVSAEVAPPYVWVGHSMGGGLVRLFATRYRGELAGIVIAASGHEDWRTRNPFGEIPLVVLSEKWVLPDCAKHRDVEAARIEDALQEEMSRYSRRGRHMRVDSGHLIPLEAADAIVSAVEQVLSLAKGK